MLLYPLPCPPTRAPPGVGFLLPFPIGLAFIFMATARRQPAPEHARCLSDKQTNERYESEVGESNLAFLLAFLQTEQITKGRDRYDTGNDDGM
jgi:hypothetical protein